MICMRTRKKPLLMVMRASNHRRMTSKRPRFGQKMTLKRSIPVMAQKDHEVTFQRVEVSVSNGLRKNHKYGPGWTMTKLVNDQLG